MRQPRRIAALLAVTLLGGCSADSDGPGDDAAGGNSAANESSTTEDPAAQGRTLQPGAPGEEGRELTASEMDDLEWDTDATEADVRFMQDMVGHHVQALRMTRLVPNRTSREDVPVFAERIDISQEDEIDLMRSWLETHEAEVPSLLPGHGHEDDVDHAEMPGMLTEDEMEELEAADGEEFDRLFLEGMIYHHLGAIEMVQELFDAGGGIEPEIATFANHVVSDQQIEIDRAQRMLAEIEAGG